MECTKCRREIVDGAAFCPYCGEKVAEEAKPLYTAEVKGLLKSGTLAVYADRVEFITSNVQRMVIVYSTLVSVKKGLDRIVFMTEDGRSESCAVNRKNIHEAFYILIRPPSPISPPGRSGFWPRGSGTLWSAVWALPAGCSTSLMRRWSSKARRDRARPPPFGRSGRRPPP